MLEEGVRVRPAACFHSPLQAEMLEALGGRTNSGNYESVLDGGATDFGSIALNVGCHHLPSDHLHFGLFNVSAKLSDLLPPSADGGNGDLCIYRIIH